MKFVIEDVVSLEAAFQAARAKAREMLKTDGRLWDGNLVFVQAEQWVATDDDGPIVYTFDLRSE